MQCLVAPRKSRRLKSSTNGDEILERNIVVASAGGMVENTGHMNQENVWRKWKLGKF